jgi:RNA polymerase sigma-70 factor (ECF subfamily)
MTSSANPELPAEGNVPAEVRRVLDQLWNSSSALAFEVEAEEFARLLLHVGRRYNFGYSHEEAVSPREQARFLEQLRADDLVLAYACAQGNNAAWERFLTLYRETLYQAAYSIAGSDSSGRELADSLYADLYGLRQKDGQRQSPLLSYHGRGSLAGWLRSVLAQRYVDHFRRHRRETSLDEQEEQPAPPGSGANPAWETSENWALLRRAVEEALRRLSPEEGFLLASYYLDERTLRELAMLLNTHPSTISRRLERIRANLRKRILQALRRAGLDRRQAEETVQLDVRDLDLPVKNILQIFRSRTFQVEKAIMAEGGNSDAR